ncbi:MAG: hypothetical protein MJB57_02665 [Gemmatimonadetes bacterium]|nr:hypothetical protein [Gemmatimonadota bacterium]
MARFSALILLAGLLLPFVRSPLCDAATHHAETDGVSGARAQGGSAQVLGHDTADAHRHRAGSGGPMPTGAELEALDDCHDRMGCDLVVTAVRGATPDPTVRRHPVLVEPARARRTPPDAFRTPTPPPPRAI